MKKENKNTILDASGWLWLAIMMVAAGVVGLMQPMTFESVTFSIMLIICGAALIYAVVSGIIMFWKKD